MRRVRIETLIVRDGAGREREIASFSAAEGGRIASQRRYLVSPDGQHLVHADRSGERLTIMPASGKARRVEARGLSDFRFTDGGRHVVAVTRDRLLRHSLANGTTRAIGDGRNVRWMEPCRDGLVLLRGRGRDNEVALRRWDGTEKVLARADHVTRLMAARGGRRIAFCAADGLFDLSSDGDMAPRRLGETHGRVTNGEMSADGSRIVVATNRALLEARGSDAPRPLWVERNILAVWLQGEDVLAGSRQRAVFIRGKRKTPLPRGRGRRGLLGNLRFARDGGGGAIVVQGGDVHRWIPGRRLERLASLGNGKATELLGAQRWAGGTVLWTARYMEQLEGLESFE